MDYALPLILIYYIRITPVLDTSTGDSSQSSVISGMSNAWLALTDEPDVTSKELQRALPVIP